MTNEQLGREWCGRNGKRPKREGPACWSWGWCLPTAIAGYCGSTFASEEDAYAAVGLALRAVERLGDEVRAMLGGEVSQ